MGRWKKLTFKNLIFGNFWGPEVVGSSSYQKNIGAEFTHLYRPSLCFKIVVNRHDLGHSNCSGSNCKCSIKKELNQNWNAPLERTATHFERLLPFSRPTGGRPAVWMVAFLGCHYLSAKAKKAVFGCYKIRTHPIELTA